MTDHAKPYLVVSDLHLGVGPVERSRAFREFLRFAAEEAGGLLINGDLFDVWLATRHFVVRHHVRELAAIADLVDAGVPVQLVGGNHDPLELGGTALQELGVTLLHEPARLSLGGWRALVIHGDGVQRNGPSYPHYQKRHALLRSAPLRWMAGRLLHLDSIHDRIAAWSTTAAHLERRENGNTVRPDAPPIERWATAALHAESDVDIVLAGHSHLPALREIQPRRFYMNSGDWISHMTYGVLPADGGRPALHRWPERSPVQTTI